MANTIPILHPTSLSTWSEFTLPDCTKTSFDNNLLYTHCIWPVCPLSLSSSLHFPQAIYILLLLFFKVIFPIKVPTFWIWLLASSRFNLACSSLSAIVSVNCNYILRPDSLLSWIHWVTNSPYYFSKLCTLSTSFTLNLMAPFSAHFFLAWSISRITSSLVHLLLFQGFQDTTLPWFRFYLTGCSFSVPFSVSLCHSCL